MDECKPLPHTPTRSPSHLNVTRYGPPLWVELTEHLRRLKPSYSKFSPHKHSFCPSIEDAELYFEQKWEPVHGPCALDSQGTSKYYPGWNYTIDLDCGSNECAFLATVEEGPRTDSNESQWQGLTLVHFSAQRKRLLWDRGCAEGVYRGC